MEPWSGTPQFYSIDKAFYKPHPPVEAYGNYVPLCSPKTSLLLIAPSDGNVISNSKRPLFLYKKYSPPSFLPLCDFKNLHFNIPFSHKTVFPFFH